MLRAVAVQALKVVKRPDCSCAEFAEVVERDPKLATDMLKLANSPIYSPGRPISNLHQAVIRLGLRESKNLIMTSSIASLMKSIEFREEWIRDLLWRHSFFTAMLALHLNRTLDCGFHGEEFTAGLLHDFGRTLLAHIFPDEFLSIDPLEFDESCSPEQHEQTQLGMTHTTIGGWFAELNQLPEELVAAIRFHHIATETVPHARLVALTAAADHMSNHLQRYEESQGYPASENEAVEVLEQLGVHRAIARFAEAGFSIIDEAASDVERLISM